MNPEKRRELYGLLNTAHAALRACLRACPPELHHTRLMDITVLSTGAIGVELQELEKEIDDAS